MLKTLVTRKYIRSHDFLCFLVVKRELEAEAVALAEKEKAAPAEVCITLIC